MTRPYESMISLDAGMVLMFQDSSLYLGGESEVVSIGVMLSAAAFEFLGFFLAYLAYKTSI